MKNIKYKVEYSWKTISAYSYNNAIELQNDLVNSGNTSAKIISY